MGDGWCSFFGSVVVVVVKDHEVFCLILQCDDLQVVTVALEKSNQCKVALGLDVDGCDLCSIDSKLVSLLNDGILHEEEWLESCKSGFGNQFTLHVAKEDCGMILLQTGEESGLVSQHSCISGHPLHGILVLVFEHIGNCPIGDEGSQFQCLEKPMAVVEALDLQVGRPELAVADLGSIDCLKLRLIVIVDERNVAAGDISEAKRKRLSKV